MRKVFLLVALVAALAIPATALADVYLHEPHVGTTCEFGGTFHFVANGVNSQVGSLTVWFDGIESDIGVSTKYNRGTNHWTIEATGTLTNALATEGDKLVLSDYTCFEKKAKT